MKTISEFFKLEAAGGIIIVFAAVLALVMKNSPLSDIYDLILNIPMHIQIGAASIKKPILLWINDGLMAIFFLLVALEIKREFVEGELSSFNRILLPGVAAIGGMLFPAIFYVWVNWGDAYAIRGWAIPAATDIAFALGVISLLGSRVPKELKLILVAIAILDDIGAIAIIAVFYTADLSIYSLVLAAVAVIVLLILNKKKVQKLSPYMLVGFFFWVCVLKSGVHATLAGVVLGLFIPIKPFKPGGNSMLKKLEHDLHPWVTFAVLPIFAFANAGVPLAGMSAEMFLNPITLGVMTGLSLGAPIGVILFSAGVIFTKLSSLPKGVNWRQYIGMAMLTGIGFTMSLFIGTLAFDTVEYQNDVRIGVLFASLLSGIVGVSILLNAKKNTAS
jgi:Na+:H+ antiporter, NhaA family